MNTYINVPKTTDEEFKTLIVPSDHGNEAGIIGSLYLGKLELERAEERKSAKGLLGFPGGYAGVGLLLLSYVAVGALVHMRFSR